MDILEAKNLVIRAGHELLKAGLIVRTWGNISCRINEAQFVSLIQLVQCTTPSTGQNPGRFPVFFPLQAKERKKCSTWVRLTWQKVLLLSQVAVFTLTLSTHPNLSTKLLTDSTEYSQTLQLKKVNQLNLKCHGFPWHFWNEDKYNS